MRYQRNRGPSFLTADPTYYSLVKFFSLLTFALLAAPSMNFEQQRAFAQERGEEGKEKSEEENFQEPKVEVPTGRNAGDSDATDTKLECLKSAAVASSIAELKAVAERYTGEGKFDGREEATDMVSDLLDAMIISSQKLSNNPVGCQEAKPEQQSVAEAALKVDAATKDLRQFNELVLAVNKDIFKEEKRADEEIVEKEKSESGGEEEDFIAEEETEVMDRETQTASFDILAFQADATDVGDFKD